MKPRFFINMHYMALGGAERALLGFLISLIGLFVDKSI